MCAVSILNLHEDERQRPENWIPIGWMPVYDETLSKRRGTGYESNAARKAHLFRACFRSLLSSWDEKTESTQNIVWGGQKTADTIFFRRAVGGPAGNPESILCLCMFSKHTLIY